MQSNFLFVCLILASLFCFTACEEPFTPDFVDQEPTFVVEGYIRAGTTDPTFVTLSKTYALFQKESTPNQVEFYIGGAKVFVSDGSDTIELFELCLDKLSDEQKQLVKNVLNIEAIPDNLNLCFYVDILGQIKAKPNSSYDLRVEVEGKTLTASTTIPTLVPIDSMVYEANSNFDGFGTIYMHITDSPNPDYYRLKTKVNSGPFLTDFSSVTDDVLFNGKTFRFPLNKPRPPGESGRPDEKSGLFQVGDTVTIEWSNIDFEHYEFWNTLEFARTNQSPFSGYTKATTNIQGGIGIWGGYNTVLYTKIIK